MKLDNLKPKSILRIQKIIQNKNTLKLKQITELAPLNITFLYANNSRLNDLAIELLDNQFSMESLEEDLYKLKFLEMELLEKHEIIESLKLNLTKTQEELFVVQQQIDVAISSLNIPNSSIIDLQQYAANNVDQITYDRLPISKKKAWEQFFQKINKGRRVTENDWTQFVLENMELLREEQRLSEIFKKIKIDTQKAVQKSSQITRRNLEQDAEFIAVQTAQQKQKVNEQFINYQQMYQSIQENLQKIKGQQTEYAAFQKDINKFLQLQDKTISYNEFFKIMKSNIAWATTLRSKLRGEFVRSGYLNLTVPSEYVYSQLLATGASVFFNVRYIQDNYCRIEKFIQSKIEYLFSQTILVNDELKNKYQFLDQYICKSGIIIDNPPIIINCKRVFYNYPWFEDVCKQSINHFRTHLMDWYKPREAKIFREGIIKDTTLDAFNQCEAYKAFQKANPWFKPFSNITEFNKSIHEFIEAGNIMRPSSGMKPIIYTQITDFFVIIQSVYGG